MQIPQMLWPHPVLPGLRVALVALQVYTLLQDLSGSLATHVSVPMAVTTNLHHAPQWWAVPRSSAGDLAPQTYKLPPPGGPSFTRSGGPALSMVLSSVYV